MKKIIFFILYSSFVFSQNTKKVDSITFDEIHYENLKKSDTIYVAYDGTSAQTVIKSFLKNGLDSRMYSFVVNNGYDIRFTYIENTNNKISISKIKKRFIRKHKKMIVDNLFLKQLEASTEKLFCVFKNKVIFIIDYKEMKLYPVKMSYIGRDD